jgi:hypothetical protein
MPLGPHVLPADGRTQVTCRLLSFDSPAIARWVTCATAVVHASIDTSTLDDWARLVGASRTSLCDQNRLLGARPKHALDLARLARVLSHPPTPAAAGVRPCCSR